jgi:hypothetical protein
VTLDEMVDSVGDVSCDQAYETLSRFVRSHYRQNKGARISVPAGPRDDDIVMLAFIKKVERMEERAARIAALEQAKADAQADDAAYEARAASLESDLARLRTCLEDTETERARLYASLLDYWGTFGCVTSDNGKFRAKAFEVVEAELRAAEVYEVFVGPDDAPTISVIRKRSSCDYHRAPSLIAAVDALRELKEQSNG